MSVHAGESDKDLPDYTIDPDGVPARIKPRVLALIGTGCNSPLHIKNGLQDGFGTVDYSHVNTALERLDAEGKIIIDDSGWQRRIRVRNEDVQKKTMQDGNGMTQKDKQAQVWAPRNTGHVKQKSIVTAEAIRALPPDVITLKQIAAALGAAIGTVSGYMTIKPEIKAAVLSRRAPKHESANTVALQPVEAKLVCDARLNETVERLDTRRRDDSSREVKSIESSLEVTAPKRIETPAAITIPAIEIAAPPEINTAEYLARLENELNDNKLLFRKLSLEKQFSEIWGETSPKAAEVWAEVSRRAA